MLRFNRRPQSRSLHTLLLKLVPLAAVVLVSLADGRAAKADDGAPWLNAVGRFLGVGYSQHGYHSPQGRPPAGMHNRSAADYPSSRLQHIYLPAEYAMPARQSFPAAFPNTPIGSYSAVQMPQPELAPAPAAPLEPPPKWLEQYLRERPAAGQSMGSPASPQSSPSDRGMGQTPPRQPVPEPVKAKEIDALRERSSPYEDELLPEPGKRPTKPLKPNSGSIEDGNLRNDSLLGDPSDELLLDGDPLLNDTADGDDLLEADARYRIPRYVVPPTQATIHRYTPFH